MLLILHALRQLSYTAAMVEKVLATLFFVTMAWAQSQQTEIFELKSRGAEEMLPLVQKMLDKDGAVTGERNVLMVKTSPENMAQIRQLLAGFDRPLRRLWLSVRAGRNKGGDDGGVGADFRGNIGAKLGSQRGKGASVQRVQAVDGQLARISTGRSELQLRPRVTGRHVVIEVLAGQQNPTAAGNVNFQRVQSTVSALLGQWVELAGVNEAGSEENTAVGTGGIGFQSAQRGERSRYYVRVDEISK